MGQGKSLQLSDGSTLDLSQPLYGLSIHSPWGWAIARGAKTYENRSWPCPLEAGTPIAIHNTKTGWDSDGFHFITVTQGLDCPKKDHDVHQQGIIAIARFGGNETWSKDPWFFGPIGWRLEAITPVKLVPCSGRQRLWWVPQDTVKSLMPYKA